MGVTVTLLLFRRKAWEMNLALQNGGRHVLKSSQQWFNFISCWYHPFSCQKKSVVYRLCTLIQINSKKYPAQLQYKIIFNLVFSCWIESSVWNGTYHIKNSLQLHLTREEFLGEIRLHKQENKTDATFWSLNIVQQQGSTYCLPTAAAVVCWSFLVVSVSRTTEVLSDQKKMTH